MKRMYKRLALLLAVVMVLQIGEIPAARAVDYVEKVIDPASAVELTVPEALRDGSNYFFILQSDFTLSEKSTEKLYIPIQRAGSLDEAAEVTLKLVDLSSHYGIDYEAEIYRAAVEPELAYDGVSIVDVAQSGEYVEQSDAEAADELGKIVYAAGGADIVDADGNPVAAVTATPAEQPPQPAEEEAAQSPGTAPTSVLRAARNSYTGEPSDRQALAGAGTVPDSAADLGLPIDEGINMVDDTYPGREYRLHFAPGEEAKFLVLTPKYSEASDGDSQIMLMLKDPTGDAAFPEDSFISYVTITDEDAPEPVMISMKQETVTAENGSASITVTRRGRVNAMVGVHIASWDGSAAVGDDYGGVGANLYFPMGVT